MIIDIKYNRAIKRLDLRGLLEGMECEYKVEGSELRILCPNPEHADGNPSATINYNNNSNKFGWFSCFGCGYSGSLPKFVSVIKELDEEEAKRFIVRFAAENYDGESIIEKYEVENSQDENYEEIEMPEIFEPIRLGKNSSYEKYLLNRFVSVEQIKKYNWHFCPKGTLQKRVVLPVYIDGKMVCFYARHISTNDPERKVRNSKHAPIERIVFPYDEIDFNKKFIWVTESVFNFFALKKLGLPNLICLFGNKLTGWKLDLLSKFERVKFFQDGDAGGDELVFKAWKNLRNINKILFVDTPKKEDAASLNDLQRRKILLTLKPFKGKRKIKTSYDF